MNLSVLLIKSCLLYTSIDIMGWAHDDFNCDIHVDICGFNPKILSTFGVTITADILIDDVDVNNYDALAIPCLLYTSGILIYNDAFKNLRFSVANAEACLLFLVVAVFSLTQLKLTSRGGGD